jgi:hypothetical protein
LLVVVLPTPWVPLIHTITGRDAIASRLDICAGFKPAGQTALVRVAAAAFAVSAIALWLGWATRDFHDNQRNWLMVLAMASTGAALLFLMASAVRRLRNRE